MRALFLLVLMIAGCSLAMDENEWDSSDGRLFFPLYKKLELRSKLAGAIRKNDITTLGKMRFSKINESGLHIAALYGKSKCIKKLLARGANPQHATGEEYYTPLHFAGTVKVVQLLLNTIVKVDAKNENGETPLCTALFGTNYAVDVVDRSYQQSHEIAALLLKYGADINVVDKEGNSLLHKAVAGLDYHSIDFLLSNNVDVNKRNKKGLTGFEMFVSHETLIDRQDIRMLFEKHGMIFFYKETLCDLFGECHKVLTDYENEVIHNDEYDFVYWPSQEYMQCIDQVARLFIAARQYNEAQASFNDGLRCNKYGCMIQNISMSDLKDYFNPLLFKAIKRSLEFWFEKLSMVVTSNQLNLVSEFLVDFPWLRKYNYPNMCGMIHRLIEGKKTDCLETLLSNGVDFDHKAAVRTAILCDNHEAVRLFVRLFAQYEPDRSRFYQDGHAHNFLRRATKLGKKNCIKLLNELLCEQCLNRYCDDDCGKFKQLLSGITDCNGDLSNGKTLLWFVVLDSNRKAIKYTSLLLAKGAEVNIVDKSGKTLLCRLIEQGEKKYPVIELLLGAGAIVDLDLINGLGTLNMPQQLKDLMKQKYDEQKCCICLEHPRLFPISCSCNRYAKFLCEDCSKKISTCPLCRGSLKAKVDVNAK